MKVYAVWGSHGDGLYEWFECIFDSYEKAYNCAVNLELEAKHGELYNVVETDVK